MFKGAARGPGQAGHDPGAAPSRPRTREGPVTAAGLPNPAAVDRSKLLTDDQAFRRLRDVAPREGEARPAAAHATGPAGAPAGDRVLREVVRGPGAAGLARVGEGAHVTERAHGSTREAPRTLGPGEPGHRPPARPRAGGAARTPRGGAGQGRGGAQDRPAPGEGKGEGRTAQARGRGPAAGSRGGAAPGLARVDAVANAVAAGDRGDDPQLKRRLERVWLLLKLPMATRLAFLQKYASVEHAPRLEQAVGLWERAAARPPAPREAAARGGAPGGGRALPGPGLCGASAGHPREGRPGAARRPRGTAGRRRRRRGGGLRLGAAAAWLAECVETYVGRCEAAADEAEAVLGDAMPSHIDFAPPPEPPKVQRSRAGSEASLGSRA